MGEMIQVQRPDGKSCPAYLAAPKEANTRGFVCIKEYWGLNDQMMSNLNFPDAAEQDIRGAVQQLRQASKRKVAVGGFCMGGALTLLEPLRVPEMDAGACFYGLPPVDLAEFKKIKIPLICHFANWDDWCTPAKVNELENMLKRSKSKFEMYRYDAKHAFMNEARPEAYDRASAELASDHTLSFPKKALASSDREPREGAKEVQR